MKISLLTVAGSEYSLRILNEAAARALPVHTVFQVKYSPAAVLRFLRGMFARRIGWFETGLLMTERFLGSGRPGHLSRWKDRPFERDPNRLAERVVTTHDENDRVFLEAMRESAPDLLVLGQIGIVRPSILGIPRAAVINAHGAWLPEYRGNHVLYWTLYFREFHRLGYSVIKTNEGVDSGDILRFTPCPPRDDEALPAYEDRMLSEMAVGLVDVLADWNTYEKSAVPQSADGGRTYYAMPRRLRRSAEQNYLRHLNGRALRKNA